MASASGYKSDADDLIALYDHGYSNVVRNESIVKPLTKTEQKKIKTLARAMKKRPEFAETPMDVMETLARQEIIAQRSIDKTPVRGTGEAIADASKFTTAGRSASTGKIQGFLKRGTRIKKGSDYTLNDGESRTSTVWF